MLSIDTSPAPNKSPVFSFSKKSSGQRRFSSALQSNFSRPSKQPVGAQGNCYSRGLSSDCQSSHHEMILNENLSFYRYRPCCPPPPRPPPPLPDDRPPPPLPDDRPPPPLPDDRRPTLRPRSW
mmetsp:Transcript_31123/g.46226  ORF Transcript_31123/g.46226 Transcript_31123/m.46226 type:complete len:123 (+) Transcript_31123:140-508(+)